MSGHHPLDLNFLLAMTDEIEQAINSSVADQFRRLIDTARFPKELVWESPRWMVGWAREQAIPIPLVHYYISITGSIAGSRWEWECRVLVDNEHRVIIERSGETIEDCKAQASAHWRALVLSMTTGRIE